MFNGSLAQNKATDHTVTSTAEINRSIQNARETNSGYSKIRGTKVPSTGGSVVYEQAVFISYAWGDDREKIVNQIDENLQKRGIKIIRDKRDLGYKGSIKEFMERIGLGNCVIVVISDKYLRSPNCMFELIEIAKNKQFYDRVFPVVLVDATIYDPKKRIDYVKYWEAKLAELDEAMKTVGQENLQGFRDDIDLYARIREEISGLTKTLTDMNALTPEMHQDSNFDILYNAIEKSILTTRSVEAVQSIDMRSKPIDAAEKQRTITSIPTASNDEPRTIHVSQLKKLETYRKKLSKYIDGYLTSSKCWAECANAKSNLEKSRYRMSKGQSLDSDYWNEILSSLNKPSTNQVLPDTLMSGDFLESVNKFRKNLDKAKHAVQKFVKSYKTTMQLAGNDDILGDAIINISEAMSEVEAILDKCGEYANAEINHIESLVDVIVGTQKGQELLKATESRSNAKSEPNAVEGQESRQVTMK